MAPSSTMSKIGFGFLFTTLIGVSDAFQPRDAVPFWGGKIISEMLSSLLIVILINRPSGYTLAHSGSTCPSNTFSCTGSNIQGLGNGYACCPEGTYCFNTGWTYCCPDSMSTLYFAQFTSFSLLLPLDFVSCKTSYTLHLTSSKKTDTDCGAKLGTNSVCADTNWTLWDDGTIHGPFCCQEGEIAISDPNAPFGECWLAGSPVQTSELATTVGSITALSRNHILARN